MKGDGKRRAGEEQEREGNVERGAGEEQEREGNAERGAGEEQEREGNAERGAGEEQERGDAEREAGEEQEREGDAERGEGEEQEKEGNTERGAGEEQEREGEGTEQEEGRRNPAQQRSIGGDTETPTETDDKHDWSRHVPVGAWLTQVRSCLWGKFITQWNRSGSERGTLGRDEEEGLGERKFVSACTYHLST
ncbi:hypothetical protein NDU88_003816 [Pleurodeles waltl]|uniref:Uncharacterized protein n=1 Tax=Pleurodeles waltl TaxID=8319 RepID=A0AAV7KW11_PLEWA|nr:hypothetical protein NDU88_003816 [Pleurodeles waltl]